MIKKTFKNIQEFKEECGYTIEGCWYPRVTRIADMKAKPSLLKFYATMGYDRAQLISHQSAKEGTAVHEAVEALLLGRSPTVSKTILPSVEAFREFFRKNPIEVLDSAHVERLVHNKKHGYAGTLDVLAKIGGRFGVLDIKTSEGIYRDFNIQTAAYTAALIDEFPNISARWILRIDQNQQCLKCGAILRTKGGRKKIKRPNGNGTLFSKGFNSHYGIAKTCEKDSHEWGQPLGVVELKEIKDSWEDDFKAFLGAKALWEWENSDWLRQL